MTLKLPTFKSPFAANSKKSSKNKGKQSKPLDESAFSATLIAESVSAAEPSLMGQSTMMNPPTINAATQVPSMPKIVNDKELRLPIIGGLPLLDQKRYLQVGVFSFALLTMFMMWAETHGQSRAAKNTEFISTAMIDSQRMARETSAAAGGNAKALGAFNQAKTGVITSVAALSGEDGNAGLASGAQASLEQVKTTWTKISEGAESMGSGEKLLTVVGAAVEDFSASLRKARIATEKIAEARLRSGAKPAEVAGHRQMVGSLQSMESIVSSLGENGGQDKEELKTFDSARTEFARLSQAMANGSEPFAVRGEANGDAYTAFLAESNKLAKAGSEIVKNVGMISQISSGSRAVLDNADQLMRDLQNLRTVHQSTTSGGFSLSIAGLFALLALICGWGLSKVNLDESRNIAKRAEQQRADAERLEQEAKRQNEQNQAAILRLMNELQEVADGDLTVQVTVSEDITGAIADSVNYTVEELRSLVARINSTAGRVGDASGRAQQISSSLLTASEQQSREIRDTGESVLRLADSINKVSSSALESAKVARKSLDAAEQGADAVHRTIAGMSDIREQIQDTSKRIKRLGESSQEIGEIVELISDITEQTNVLALNAAIQAASAGEAGRGFTVVAEEVQRLAERSGEATKQISALIQTIQADTKDAVAAMERSTQNVVEGAKLSDAAGQALGEIGTVSRQLAELIESISVTTNREAASAGTVAQSIQRILLVTEQTSDGTQLTAGSIGQLSELAQDLRNSVTRFKVA